MGVSVRKDKFQFLKSSFSSIRLSTSCMKVDYTAYLFILFLFLLFFSGKVFK